MNRMNKIIAISLVLVLSGCGGKPRGPEAFEQSDVVHMTVATGVMATADQSLMDSEPGSGSKMKYMTRDTKSGPMLVVYTDMSHIPAGASFQSMRVWQAYKTAMADMQTYGLSVNPEVPGASSYDIRKDEITAGLNRALRTKAIPWQIHRMPKPSE